MLYFHYIINTVQKEELFATFIDLLGFFGLSAVQSFYKKKKIPPQYKKLNILDH